MKAWQVTRLGEPIDALELIESPTPEPGPDEVLIKVAAVAANFPDVLLARGQYQVRPELPFTPGIECSGTVAVLDCHERLTELAEAGSIVPVVDSVVPFTEAPAALQKLAGGATTGRVVIEVGA